MRTITYNEKEYSIPTNWNEITLEMQINAEELIKKMGNELGLIGLISAYTDIPIKAIKEGDVALMNDIHNTLAFIYEGYVPEPITEFEHNGHMYYLKDSLINSQFQDFISLMNVLNSKTNQISSIPKMVAILAKRKDETLDDFQINERAKEFNNLPLSTAKDIEAFFLTNSQELKALSLLSSKEFRNELLHMKSQSLKNSIKEWKVRNGNSLLIRLQAGIYLMYMKFTVRQLEKYFNSMFSNNSMKNSKSIWKKQEANMKENE